MFADLYDGSEKHKNTRTRRTQEQWHKLNQKYTRKTRTSFLSQLPSNLPPSICHCIGVSCYSWLLFRQDHLFLLGGYFIIYNLHVRCLYLFCVFHWNYLFWEKTLVELAHPHQTRMLGNLFKQQTLQWINKTVNMCLLMFSLGWCLFELISLFSLACTIFFLWELLMNNTIFGISWEIWTILTR